MNGREYGVRGSDRRADRAQEGTMSHPDRRPGRARKPKTCRPTLEPMERRELLSGLMVALTHQVHAPTVTPAMLEIATGGGGSSGGGSLGNPVTGVGSNILPNGSAANSPAPLLGAGQPTPHELAREDFRAVFTGPYVIAPGRFSDQSQVMFFQGVGGSTFFLHGNFNMGIATYTDPTIPASGAAVLNDKNNNGAGIVGLDIQVDPTSYDRAGRPTRLTFDSDPNIYSGIFFVSQSTGTIEIHYQPGRVSGKFPGALGQGVATVYFHGLLYTSGMTNPLRNSNLVARGGKILAVSR
jgi:hypothetical protein